MKIKKIESKDKNKLIKFFEDLENNSIIKEFFHPHPFNKSYAEKISGYKGKDFYFIALDKINIIGYAMLRGWDDGYEIPSFGICIHPDSQGRGVGRKMTEYAIDYCKKKKSPKLMLKVYKNNNAAYKLYKGLNFYFTDETKDKKQWIGYLDL